MCFEMPIKYIGVAPELLRHHSYSTADIVHDKRFGDFRVKELNTPGFDEAVLHRSRLIIIMQAFENTSTNVAAAQMRNALTNLAETVKDPEQKKVSPRRHEKKLKGTNLTPHSSSRPRWTTSLPCSDDTSTIRPRATRCTFEPLYSDITSC